MFKPRFIGRLLCAIVCLAAVSSAHAQSKQSPVDKFRQLEEILPTPNEYRTASGAPGHKYWQQKADYVIDVELDDANQRIIGSGTITYYNNSPDALSYLWLQLDQNHFRKDSDARMPVIFAVEYADGSKEEMRIPAEIWRRNNLQVSKMVVTPKEIKSITLDPHLETADTDLNNNHWPPRPVKSRFQINEADQPDAGREGRPEGSTCDGAAEIGFIFHMPFDNCHLSLPLRSLIQWQMTIVKWHMENGNDPALGRRLVVRQPRGSQV